jgi:coproporphyrinogen III oxidase-like Fe-S oxidoreductase
VVPKETDSEGMKTFHDEMQKALERVTEFAEKAVG